jgi:hypothetical protein
MPITVDEMLSRATISVPEAGHFLGLSRTGSYDAAKRGDFETIRIGGKIVVPVVPFAAKLGLQPQTPTHDGGVEFKGFDLTLLDMSLDRGSDGVVRRMPHEVYVEWNSERINVYRRASEVKKKVLSIEMERKAARVLAYGPGSHRDLTLWFGEKKIEVENYQLTDEE